MDLPVAAGGDLFLNLSFSLLDFRLFGCCKDNETAVATSKSSLSLKIYKKRESNNSTK